jgi:hypothetical protein
LAAEPRSTVRVRLPMETPMTFATRPRKMPCGSETHDDREARNEGKVRRIGRRVRF